MPYSDKSPAAVQARREYDRRYRLKKKIEKYGPELANIDLRGKHGNHAKGPRGPASKRWSGGRFVTHHGYVAVRVEPGHPHAWGANKKPKICLRTYPSC